MTAGATADPRYAMAAPAPGQGSLALLGRLLRERVRPHFRRLGLAAFCMALAAAGTAANAWLLEPAVDEVFVAKSASMLWIVPLAALAIAAIKAGASYAQDVLVGGVGQRIIADTQVALYRHLIAADLAFLQTVHSGKLISSFLYDVQLLRETVSRALTGVAKDGLTFVALSAVMFWQDWKLATLTLLVFPPIAVAIRRLGKRMRKASGKTQAETGRLSAHLAETLEGVRIVKAYGREDYEIGRAQAAVERRLAHIMKALRTRSAAAPSTEALGGVAVALAILYGGWQAQQGALTLGAFTSFLAALLMAYQPLKSLATFNTAIQEGLAAAERIFSLLDTRPIIVEAPDAPDLRLGAGELRFESVRFAYAGGRPALAGVSFTVPAGKVVALVGASGAGKSTILNLIPRFFDVEAGSVSIDGQDVRKVSLSSLRAAVALVAQETQLFDDTVAANISYGRPGASLDAIVAAAHAAAAHDFITTLPQGFDTVLGENGVRLSGGQRQRLAIARAMLKDAPILLLDEATSALDAESERQVQEALRRLMRGRTTLLVAHRLSTVQSADEIHVLEDGRIVETGSHQSLLARGGAYARLHALQERGDEAEKRRAGLGN